LPACVIDSYGRARVICAFSIYIMWFCILLRVATYKRKRKGNKEPP